MPKNSYKGSPINAAWQYITESNHWGDGETVSATSDDDKGEERTVTIPDFIDTEELNDEQQRALGLKFEFPDLTLKDFCEQFNLPYGKTSTFLAKTRREYETELRKRGVYDKLEPGERKPTTGTSETQQDADMDKEERKRVLNWWRNHIELSIDEAMEELDTDLPYNVVSGLKGSAIQHESARDDGEKQPTQQDLTDVLGPIVERLEAVEQKLDGQQRSGATIDAVDEGTLFKIISGEELTDDERKRVFEEVVE